MSSTGSRRVVITGMGLVSPLGNTPDELWDHLIQGDSGIAPLQSVPTQNLPTSIGAEAHEFTGKIDGFGELDKEMKRAIRKGLKVMCRESQMGVAAAQKALFDSSPNSNGEASSNGLLPERSGCVFGSDYMLTLPQELAEGIVNCSNDEGFHFEQWGVDGLSEMTPLWLLKYLPNMPASHIAIYNDFRGPSNSITHREAASNLSVGEAFRTIARNSADRMTAGATGTRVHPMKAVHAAQTEQLADGDPTRASRPFDQNRTGMVLGEGAGTVILEELETAKARGARIHAEVLAAASSCVADVNLIAHRDVALAHAMRAVLREAGLSPEDIGHIHAHGLSTKSSDIDESKAIVEVFGDHATKIPLVAAKSNFGNLGAGSGIVEMIASVRALQEGRLFPVLNYETPDPECPVSPVTDTETPSGNSFMNLSVTPQGQAAVLLVRRWQS